jgi:hypothetical protein
MMTVPRSRFSGFSVGAAVPTDPLHNGTEADAAGGCSKRRPCASYVTVLINSVLS